MGPGQRPATRRGRAALLLLCLLLGGSAAAAAVPLRIALRLPAGPVQGGALRAQVILLPADGEGTSVQSSAPLPGALTIEVPAGSRWQVSATAAGYWSRPVVAAAVRRPQATVDLLPAGQVAGEVRLPPGLLAPATLTMLFRSAPGAAPAVPELSLTCPVTAGRFACELPAGELDLRLQAPGFAPHAFPAARVPPAGTFDAGTLHLRPDTAPGPAR